MVDDVRDQKKRGRCERSDLAVAMSRHALSSYERVACDEEDSACSVQRSVQVGQSVEVITH